MHIVHSITAITAVVIAVWVINRANDQRKLDDTLVVALSAFVFGIISLVIVPQPISPTLPLFWRDTLYIGNILVALAGSLIGGAVGEWALKTLPADDPEMF